MTVSDILSAMDTIAPFRFSMDFDNTGLLIGDSEQTVHSVLLALDCTDSVLDTAIKTGSELILTHHPVIFHGLKQIPAHSIVWKAIRNNISVISAHTNLDIAKGGVNDCLANKLGLTQLSGLSPLPTEPEESLGRVGFLPTPCSASALAQQVKAVLGSAVRFCDGGKPVQRVAVCGGAGDSELEQVLACGADAFVTGEVAQHIFVEAAHQGLTLIEAGHYHTEAVVLQPLCQRLTEQFPEIHFSVYDASIVQTL